MKFTLNLGLFPHHQKHCEVKGNAVNIETHFSVFPDMVEHRKVKNNQFRYNNHLYKIPDNDGFYTFNDLHIKTV